jgi:hypothetical protein
MKKKKYIEGGDVAAVGSLVSSVGMGNPYAMAAGIGLNLIGNFIENGSDPSGRTYNKNANPFGQMKYGGNVNAETINAEGVKLIPLRITVITLSILMGQNMSKAE